jgi:DNA polymerase I-like protein with 3'-5' exonuclease and polymerase domains
MIQAVEDRADVHKRTAKMMFSIPEDLCGTEDDVLGSMTDPEEIKRIRNEKCSEVLAYNPLPNMSCRQAGKKSNHSFNYGLSPNGFSNNYDMELNYAKRCYALYHSGYPGIRTGHEHVRNQLNQNRTLTNLFGWKRRFLDRMNDDLFKAAYAFNPQSTVGRLLNEGIIKSYNDQYDPDKSAYMRPVDMLNQVHDSLEGQYPLDNLEGYAKALINMKDNLDVPLKIHGREFVIRTDCKVGFNLKKMSTINLDCSEDEVVQQLRDYVAKNHHTMKCVEAIKIEDVIEETLEQIEDDIAEGLIPDSETI